MCLQKVACAGSYENRICGSLNFTSKLGDMDEFEMSDRKIKLFKTESDSVFVNDDDQEYISETVFRQGENQYCFNVEEPGHYIVQTDLTSEEKAAGILQKNATVTLGFDESVLDHDLELV